VTVAAGADGLDSRVVTAVVCAAFDPATDDEIFAAREFVRTAGIALPPRPPHRPHFSLAAARVDRRVGLPAVVAVAAGVAASHHPIDVVLGEVGRFGRAGVIWLGPEPNPALGALQRDVADALIGAGWPPAFGQRSDPARWVPHCTLATRIPKPQLRGVQAAVRARYQPIRGSVDALATILVGGRGDAAHTPLGGIAVRNS
jgi:2'-5' RNA ligase